ncbi:MAG: hypothetical protein WB502_14580, partial [Thermoactinomyces sp.]
MSTNGCIISKANPWSGGVDCLIPPFANRALFPYHRLRKRASGGKDMADSIYEWRFDPRLNIRRLVLRADPDRLTDAERAELAARYQEMAAQIPAQVKAFEKRYMACYEELKQAEDDETFYSLID